MRGVYDRKGEQFAYLNGGILYTLDGEPSGKHVGDYIVDLAGNKRWRIIGDALSSLDFSETIGYIGAEQHRDWF